MQHPSSAALEAGLAYVRDSPPDNGIVALIVRRPAVDEREVLAEATLAAGAGLVGDTWPGAAQRQGRAGPGPATNRDEQPGRLARGR